MKRLIITGLMALGMGALCLSAQAPAAPAKKGPAPKSKAELEALQALIAANTPEATIAAAEALITKFADTDYKSVALFAEADAYKTKKDSDHMVIFAEKTLEASPTEFRAALLLAEFYATHTKENDLDKEEKLAKAEKYANAVVEMMKTLPNPNPGPITEEQWTAAKKDSSAEAYNWLGMAQLTRKKPDLAFNAFKLASEMVSVPEPAYMVRAASALQSGGKNDDAIVWCDKVIAVPNVHPQVKSVATQIRAAAVKAGGKAPAGEAK
jgi:hypothetical protein